MPGREGIAVLGCVLSSIDGPGTRPIRTGWRKVGVSAQRDRDEENAPETGFESAARDRRPLCRSHYPVVRTRFIREASRRSFCGQAS